MRGGSGAVPGRCGAVPGRSRVRPYSGGGGGSRGGAAAMDLHILEHRVRVLSLARRGLWLYTHPLLKLLFLPQRCRCKFFSLTETPEDYTVMLDEEGFKELPPSEFMQVADSTWLVLSVVSNGREPPGCQATGVTKIARSVIAPLAEHHVSVLMLSTYQTDFILVSDGHGGTWLAVPSPLCALSRGGTAGLIPLPGQVRERDLPVVIHTLAGEFDIYKEEGGECVPVTCDDVSNGFLKPKPPASPTLHPVQSPQTRFCVLTVAPDTLPAIATMLIDVLFYSHSPPWDAATSSQDLDSITFFSFSLIEGYISIVMDAETQKRFPSDLLLTSSTGELWRMVRIGGQPLGFDECGIVAQIAEPLAAADISAYYISTFNFDHALVPEEGIAEVIQLLQQRQEGR
ncbi:cytosolic arginine sensor for mTORC1 subunit 1 isoform X1 [Passer domesticus]